MLKITRLFDDSTPNVFRVDGKKIVDGIADGRANETGKNLSNSKNSKNKKFKNLTYIGGTKKSMFLTPNAKKTFNYLRQKFIKASIP